MQDASPPRYRRVARRPLHFLALACLAGAAHTVPATAATGEVDRPGGGELSPRLAELARPAVRSAPPPVQAEALGLPPAGPGSLLREGERVLVEVRFERGAAAAVDDLRDIGARPIDVSRRYQTATVAALPSELPLLSSLPGVFAASEVLTPIVAASTCPAGVAVSEGDVHLRAPEARSAFGVDGTGIEVGVLSDSFDEDEAAPTDASDDAASGDLPGAGNTCPGQATPVDVLEDFNSPSAADEGRAMAQIVHDVAPGAEISFATAFTGMTAFADNIEDLAEAGADAIVDDVSYFEEPFFQEGPVGVAVSNVTADGVAYFSSAGNNNLIDGAGRNIASWEAPQFRQTTCPPGVPAYATKCMDFDPGAGQDSTLGLTVSAGVTLVLDLQWAQPWNGVSTDLDAYLLNGAGASLEDSESFNVTVTRRPFEFIVWENSTGTAQTVQLAINRCDLSCDATGAGDSGSPRLKVALLQNGGGVTASEYPESAGGDVVGPTIFGHNGAADAVSTGAVRFDTTTAPEAFSSRGPVTHYFAPVSGIGAAPPLPSPAVLSKPDVAATDGGANTFFGSLVGGVWRFFGTSASAPHAAAVAALMYDRSPTLTPDEVRGALAASARPVGAFGPEAVGAGLVDALGAVQLAVPGQVPSAAGPDPSPSAEPESATSPTTASRRSKRRPAPSTFLRRRPPKVLRTYERLARAVFRFGSDTAGVVFFCRFDRERFHPCRRTIVRRPASGQHALRVKARAADGQTDPTPAVFRFRVKRVG